LCTLSFYVSIHSISSYHPYNDFSVLLYIRASSFYLLPGQKTQSDSKPDHIQGVVLRLWEGGVSGTKTCYSYIISSLLQTTWTGEIDTFCCL